jgi:hypothetical protein
MRPNARLAAPETNPGEAARVITARLESDPSTAPARPPSAPGAAPAALRYPELRLWQWLLALAAEAAGRRAVGQVAPLATNGALQQPFVVSSRIGVLPEDDPSSAGRMLSLAAAHARAGRAEAAAQLLDDLIDRLQEGAAAGGAGVGGGSAPLSSILVPACVYAQLLDSCEDPFLDSAPTPAPSGADGSGGDSDGGGELGGGGGKAGEGAGAGDALRRLVAFQLKERAQAAPRDSLAAPSAALARLLGARHPVARALAELAEANMSPAARQAREVRRQQQAAAASMDLLKVCTVAMQRRDPCAAARPVPAAAGAFCWQMLLLQLPHAPESPEKYLGNIRFARPPAGSATTADTASPSHPTLHAAATRVAARGARRSGPLDFQGPGRARAREGLGSAQRGAQPGGRRRGGGGRRGGADAAGGGRGVRRVLWRQPPRFGS